MNKWQPWILTLISGFAVYLFDKLVGIHIKWDQISAVPIINFLTIKIALYQIIIFFILFFILRWVLLKRKKKTPVNHDSIYTHKQEQLRKFKQIELWGLLWKWDVYFDYGKPKITNLTPYHEHQGTPIKMASDRIMDALVCGVPGCQVKMPTSWMYEKNVAKATQLIESLVEQEWEKINDQI